LDRRKHETSGESKGQQRSTENMLASMIEPHNFTSLEAEAGPT
jgi:hypothetical protein